MAMIKIEASTMHLWSIRLCAFVFFFAFLGNVIDGPLMFALIPPAGGFSARGMVCWNEFGLLLAFTAALKPKWWPALAACWHLWYVTFINGGQWFIDAWDTMLLDVGFLVVLLSTTLSFSDGEVDEVPGTRAPRLADPKMSLEAGLRNNLLSVEDRSNLAHEQADVPEELVPCLSQVALVRTLVELSLSLAAFRIFFAPGLLKMRIGDDCWKELNCLREWMLTQPAPRPSSWFVHWYFPSFVLSVVQFVSVNMAECSVPLMLLSFLVGMGPVSWTLEEVLGREHVLTRCVSWFPGRALGALFIMIFVSGLFISANLAFMQPLTAVPLVASLGTVRRSPCVWKNPRPGIRGKAIRLYRMLGPPAVLSLVIFASLPSLKAYMWMLQGNEKPGPLLEPVLSSSMARMAEDMYLGIDYQRMEFFANPVHSRIDVVLLVQFPGANLSDSVWTELDIPMKVGRTDRMPGQSAPLWRRFAWFWWFLPLTGNQVVGSASAPEWFQRYLELLCEGNELAWDALELGPAHGRRDAQRVAIQLFEYKFSAPGSSDWWVRKSLGNTSWPGLGSAHVERLCG